MYFDRFDICEAYYVAAHDYGQYGVISRLDRIGFRMSPLNAGRESLSENGQIIFDELVARIEECDPLARHDPYADHFPKPYRSQDSTFDN